VEVKVSIGILIAIMLRYYRIFFSFGIKYLITYLVDKLVGDNPFKSLIRLTGALKPVSLYIGGLEQSIGAKLFYPD
jgi:hypothetical protein